MKIGLFGRGRLGRAIAAEAGEAVSWQLGRDGAPGAGVDVAIDASHAEAVAQHLRWAIESRTDLVIGATGWTIEDLEQQVAERIGVLVASNFSLSVALLARLSTVLGRFAALEPDRDPFILERHHRAKADAPSGTARTLARAMIEALPRKRRLTLGTPTADELSVGFVRAGSELGTHVVGLDAPGELLEITHSVRSRSVFAQGALHAARWIRGRKGVFDMEAVAAELLDPVFAFGGET